MKLNSMFRLATIGLCCVAALLGCKKSGGSADTKEPKITGSPSDPPVAIVPKWTPGQRYIMRMESSQSYQLPNFMAGRGAPGVTGTNNPPLQNSFAQDYALVVTNAADGQRGIELEILGIELVASRGEQEFVNYDSHNKVAPRTGPMTDVFDQLIGAKINYLVSPENKVVKVEGIKELFDRIEPPTDPANPNAGAAAPGRRGPAGGMLRGAYNEDMFKQLIELSGTPPNSVRVGESWTTTREAGAPVIGKLIVTTTNTLRGWQEHDAKKCARVDFTGALDVSSTGATNPLSAFVKIESGTVAGHYWFAPDVGIPIEIAFEQMMTITLPNFGGGQMRRGGTNRPNGTGNADTTVSVSAPVHQNVSLKLVEVKPINGQ